MNYMFEKKHEATNGDFYDMEHYEAVIKDSCKGYRKDGSLLFALVKGAIPEDKREKYKKVIKPVAKTKTKNRGASAGEVDISKFPKKAVAFCNKNGEEYTDDKKRFSVFYKDESGKIVNRCQSNQTRCGVAGHFDKVAGLPCRKVGWSRDNLEKHNVLGELSLDIQKAHKEEANDSYLFQESISNLSPDYLFDGSIYSTMTLNYDFRTACHKDKGDLVGGLSTLTIFEDVPDNYDGFYLGLPEYKIAFDLRDGDTLIFDAHEYHANTEYFVKTTRLPEKGTEKHFAGRISVVCYLRDKMKNCPKKIILENSK